VLDVVDSGSRPGDFAYDVALSFAGEQRAYVEEVADELRHRGIRPFYDDYEKASLWGKDLYEHLDWVYQKAARFCVLFASETYAAKVWTTHERRSAQARALQAGQEYILPVRFDDTEIPGLRPTVMYLEASSTTPAALAMLLVEKLGPRVRKNFIPPEPDLLVSALAADSDDEQRAVHSIATSFMRVLTRMTANERKLVAHIFAEGCREDLPDNMHMSLDLLRRDFGVAPTEIVERIRAMTSLGFEQEIRTAEAHDDDVIIVTWSDMTNHEDDFVQEFAFEMATEVAVRMLDVAAGGPRCHEHFQQYLERLEQLDFSGLASSTATT
jgi:hypothetical protein